MSVSVQNLEEASTIASEFVAGLDNLPSEVQHLLQEMKHKETRSQEIQQEIAKESSKYIRHSLRHSSGSPSPGTPAEPSSASTPTASSAGAQPNSKAHLPPKIAMSYAEIDHLAEEKIHLAQRIVELLARTKARLEVDLARVGVLQGEPLVDYPKATITAAAGFGAPLPLVAALGGGTADVYTYTGRNPALQINDSLRNALSASSPGEIALPQPGPVASISTGPSAHKRRRLTTQTSIKLPSPAPQTASGVSVSGTHPRSRLSRVIHPPRTADHNGDAGGDPDAEGEEDADAEGDEGDDGEGEDKEIYCFCQRLSFGEMIACDNKDCPYQWFHLPCVNLKAPPAESWFCSECQGKSGAGRKGRKKQ